MEVEVEGMYFGVKGWRWRLRGFTLRLRCSLGLRGGG